MKVTKTGDNAYLVSVPNFIFIGYDEPTFKVATEDGGVLSWATPDIDKLEMVNEILNDDAPSSTSTPTRTSSKIRPNSSTRA